MKRSVIVMAALLFAGCSIRPYVKEKPVDVKMTADAKTPAAEKSHGQNKPRVYRLGFDDIIEVKFFNNFELNEELVVRPDGRISMQKVGDIYVSGLTPMELQEIITQKYAEIVRDPDVTVIVRNFGGYQVYALGEVRSPGAFPLQQKMTILQALAMAGGQTDRGELRSIMLLRKGVDGETTVERVNLSASSPETFSAENMYLQAFDIIYVPKSFIANVNSFLEQAFSGILPPLDVYLRAVMWTNIK